MSGEGSTASGPQQCSWDLDGESYDFTRPGLRSGAKAINGASRFDLCRRELVRGTSTSRHGRSCARVPVRAESEGA
jgi:hypothetical protein